MSGAKDATIAETYKDRLNALRNGGGRKILGIVGPPGCGKSTLAAALLDLLGDDAVAVPMDGYHLANVELARLGRAGRKGAEDTFDSAGYVSLLRRLKSQQENEIVYAPEFRREIEEPIAGAIPIFPETQLLITEGNYLLLDTPSWREVSAQIDENWYCATESSVRVGRLVDRHVQFGKAPDSAHRWVEEVDEVNARLVERSAWRADVTVDMARLSR